MNRTVLTPPGEGIHGQLQPAHSRIHSHLTTMLFVVVLGFAGPQVFPGAYAQSLVNSSDQQALEQQKKKIEETIVQPCKDERDQKAAPMRASIAECDCKPAAKQQQTKELEAILLKEKQRCDQKGVDALEQFKREIARESALKNARTIRYAISKSTKPPFRPLWDYYSYNRQVAQGLVPDENRCAIVLSMTLGLEPRPGEANLQQLGHKGLIGSITTQIRSKAFGQPISAKEVTDAEIARRYYIRAQELANRLKNEWGPPAELQGENAKKSITGKTGIVFIEHAYPRAGSLGARTGDHIDVWDSDHVASTSSTPFDKAEKVWFWEIH